MKEMEEQKSKWIECIDCGQTFEFSIGEQAFYRANGLEETKRCEKCRARKRKFKEEWRPKWIPMEKNWRPKEQKS